MNLSAAERADAYLHGLMTDREVATFERDLEQDADLRAVLETARRRMALLESALPPAEADERLINHTMYRIEANEKRRKRLRKRLWYGLLTPLTVAILAIGFLHVHYDNLSATPANLEVFGQNQLIPGSQAALRVRLTDGNTHAPIANVPVEVSLGDPGTANYRTLANFTTDALGNGQPSFRLPDWADGSYTLRVAAQTADAPELLTQRITLKRSSKLMLTTDKPVYQPGQTIHMRSLTLRKPDLKPLANANATFRVTDPKGNVIFQKTETTSKYGIAAADCPLADEIIEGNYVIFARVGDTESSVAVQVFHYVLPKIQLTVTTDKTWYAPGDEVKGKIEARYFHGEPVADAEWKVAILISPDFRPEVEAKGQTDPAGRTAFSLRLPMNLPAAYQPNGWNLTTILRDRAGQERDKATPLSISDQPLKFDLVPESGSLVDGYSNRVYIFASTPDGMPAKVKGQWRGLNSETLHDFETNELGVGVIEIMLLVETASLHLSARDSAGRKAECDAQLSMVRSTNDFLLRTDQAVYTGGDSMKISAWGSGPEPLFLDILKDGQTIRSGTINLGDRPGASGTGEWIIDLPPELFGVLEIRAYRMEAYREPITKTRSIYVRPASTVVISAKPNRPEYRPGDKAIIAFTLTDGFDKPAPGALSLSAIDEAVFALARSRPGLEASILHLDHELINPFAAGPIGSPESPVANDDSRLLESARSARSVQTQLTAIPLTLGAGTFETKKQETEVRKSDRLTAVRIAWVVVVVIAILTLYAVSWFYLKWRFYAAMHAAAFLSLACVCSMFLLVNTANTEFLQNDRCRECHREPNRF